MSQIPPAAFMGWPGLPPATPRSDAETWVRLAQQTLDNDRALFAEALGKLADANRAHAKLRRVSLATWTPKSDALRAVNRRRRLVRQSAANLANAARALAAAGGE